VTVILCRLFVVTSWGVGVGAVIVNAKRDRTHAIGRVIGESFMYGRDNMGIGLRRA
jgi:hypothetical protein